MDLITVILLLHFEGYTIRSEQPDPMTCGDRLLEAHMIALDAPDYLLGQCIVNVTELPSLRPVARPW